MYDYLCIQSASEQRDEISPYVAMGCALTSLANRISYDFNLKGPSVSVDTACSGSLVALHLACRSLWSGESALALAGGVNVIISASHFVAFSAATMPSPEGRYKVFDAGAHGFVRLHQRVPRRDRGQCAHRPRDRHPARPEHGGDHRTLPRRRRLNGDATVAATRS